MYLQSIMSNYLNESNQKSNIENDFNPIKKIKKDTWHLSENKYMKTFKFDNVKFLEQFIVEIIKYNRETSASIETRFRDNSVGVLIHFSSGGISEIEIEASEDIDKIKKDVMYYYAE
jgi:hypothetical protein